MILKIGMWTKVDKIKDLMENYIYDADSGKLIKQDAKKIKLLSEMKRIKSTKMNISVKMREEFYFEKATINAIERDLSGRIQALLTEFGFFNVSVNTKIR